MFRVLEVPAAEEIKNSPAKADVQKEKDLKEKYLFYVYIRIYHRCMRSISIYVEVSQMRNIHYKSVYII